MIEHDGVEIIVYRTDPAFAAAAEAAGAWFDVERQAWSFPASVFSEAEVQALVAEHPR